MTTEQYVITQDTVGLFRQIRPAFQLETNEQFLSASGEYFACISDVLQTALPQTKVTSFTEEAMNKALRERARTYLQDNPDGLCICLDRFMLQDLDTDPATENQISRIGVCRDTRSEKVARQGFAPLEDQIRNLLDRAAQSGKTRAIIIDDGLFTGGTVQEIIRLIQESGSQLEIDKIIGYIGNGSSSNTIEGVDAEIIERIADMYDWVDIRDFSPLGGKKKDAGNRNKASSAIPYIYPWSMGEGASLTMSPDLFRLSKQMIASFQKLLSVYEEQTGNTPLTFYELVKAGFPLPTNRDKTVPVSLFEPVNEYLARCIEQVEQEEKRNVVVLDMDGTLYDLGAAGFAGSELNSRVNENGIRFIMQQESCDRECAEIRWQEALQDPVGASRFLSETYGISRNAFFDQVWDINPETILKNYEEAVSTIRNFADTVNTGDDRVKMVLLTSAPSVWAAQVINYLGLSDVFESVYTGDMFGTKDEIFDILASRYIPERIVSIGDQEQTDIRPARERNMQTILINKPSDIASIDIFV